MCTSRDWCCLWYCLFVFLKKEHFACTIQIDAGDPNWANEFHQETSHVVWNVTGLWVHLLKQDHQKVEVVAVMRSNNLVLENLVSPFIHSLNFLKLFLNLQAECEGKLGGSVESQQSDCHYLTVGLTANTMELMFEKITRLRSQPGLHFVKSEWRLAVLDCTLRTSPSFFQCFSILNLCNWNV